MPVVFIELYEAGFGCGLANKQAHYKDEEERASPPVSRHVGGDVTPKQYAAAADWPPRRPAALTAALERVCVRRAGLGRRGVGGGGQGWPARTQANETI